MTVDDLRPENIEKAVRFVKSHSNWLERYNIALVDQMEELEVINHEYKITTMDFGALVTGVIEYNKISARCIKMLVNPKY